MGQVRTSYDALSIIILISFFLVGPAAASAAAAATADFTIRGAVEFTPSVQLVASPMAAIISETRSLDMLSFASDRIQLCEHEKRYPEAEVLTAAIQAPYIDYQVRCYPLTNVSMNLDLSGDQAGWLGFYPANHAHLHIEARSARSSHLSVLASPEMTTASSRVEDTPDWPFYLQRVTSPHLILNASGDVRFEGGGALKLKGPDVALHADENRTTHQTEDQPSSGFYVRERIMRWITIDFEDANLSFVTMEPVSVVARTLSGAWEGRVAFTPTAGGATTDAGHYPSTGRREWFDGTFVGELAPTREAGESRIVFHGALGSTSIPLQPGAIVSASPGWVALPMLAAVAAAGACVGGGVLLRRHRRDRDAETRYGDALEYYFHYASLAQDMQEREIALDWLQAGRAHVPTDPQLAMWEALLHRGLCQYAEAIEDAEVAAKYAPADEGESDYYLAAIYMESSEQEKRSREGRILDRQQAFFHLERALQREPGLVDAIEHDEAFGPLRGPEFESMVCGANDYMRRERR